MGDFKFWTPIFITAFSTIGLALWNYWQQKSILKLNRENEKEKVVHRVQFEKEFEVYNDLWTNLVELKALTVTLRPRLDVYDGRPREVIVNERLTKFKEGLDKCRVSFENNRPFFAESVHIEVSMH